MSNESHILIMSHKECFAHIFLHMFPMSQSCLNISSKNHIWENNNWFLSKKYFQVQLILKVHKMYASKQKGRYLWDRVKFISYMA